MVDIQTDISLYMHTFGAIFLLVFDAHPPTLTIFLKGMSLDSLTHQNLLPTTTHGPCPNPFKGPGSAPAASRRSTAARKTMRRPPRMTPATSRTTMPTGWRFNNVWKTPWPRFQTNKERNRKNYSRSFKVDKKPVHEYLICM